MRAPAARLYLGAHAVEDLAERGMENRRLPLSFTRPWSFHPTRSLAPRGTGLLSDTGSHASVAIEAHPRASANAGLISRRRASPESHEQLGFRQCSQSHSSGAIVLGWMNGDPNLRPSQQDVHPPAPRRERARLVAGLILAGLGLAFALVNLRNVKVDWIVGNAHSPLILVIAVSVLIGVGIDRTSRARKRSKSPDA
jgi:uncharacterized integral membrane protein